MIRYDYLNMMRSQVGAEGVAPEDLQAMAGRLEQARQALAKRRQDGSLGFFDAPAKKSSLAAMRDILKGLDKEIDTLIVIGIGGSNLGAMAVEAALGGRLKKAWRFHQPLRLVWAGDATDPEAVADVIAGVDWKKTALNVISKSGDTIEPMSVFILLRERLVKAVGKAKAAARIIATTDPRHGTLRDLADREGYAALPVPGNIGGRFSVMTEVGAFPILAAGIDIEAMWNGAAKENEAFWKTPALKNPALIFAGLQCLLYVQGKRISVLMPYVKRLFLTGFWFRQLWAESLGKKHDRTRSNAHIGPTPIAAVGPADQHSQIQLYNEGPNDKSVTFVEIETFSEDFRLPTPFPDQEGLAYFGGRTMSEIVSYERQATAMSLAASRRPNGTLFMPDLGAASLGAFLQFMMAATAVAGEVLGVNAFDQPGVEAGKRAMEKLLDRKNH
jgi:glucose-6-phosphate isomerase